MVGLYVFGEAKVFLRFEELNVDYKIIFFCLKL